VKRRLLKWRMSFATTPNRLRCLAVLIALALVSGCKTVPEAPRKFTFFPPSPDEPRVQFLTAFSSDSDLGRSGSFVEYLTGKPASMSKVVKPYGLAVKQGKVSVCDTGLGAIEVFDLAQRRAAYFAPPGEGQLRVPVNISIDEDGTQYVTDTGRNQVLIFSAEGAYLAALGKRDEMRPTDVAIASDRLYITDLKASVVRVYRKADRKLLFTIPRNDDDPKARLFQPTNLALDGQGRLLVSDTGGFDVQIYDLEGHHLRTIGQQGVAPGLFARPKGIAVNREGQIFVVDAATQVVQMFDAEGRLLMYFGMPGASDAGQLCLPAAVKVDYDNLSYFQSQVAPGFRLEYVILVTSQFGRDKVNVYGFVQKE
jgi:DNA-binding beta-propeller fold protein YncE